MDRNLEFSDAQDLSGAGSVASTNQVDLALAAPNLGIGTPIWLVVRVNTAFTLLTSLTVMLQDAAANTGYAQLLEGATIPVAELIAGADLLVVALPATHKRWLSVYYTIVGTNPGAGKVDAYLTLTPPRGN